MAFFWFQAFNKCKREGFRLQTVDKAPLAKRRKMKKTSTSTETRSSSSESTHSSSSSSQSQEKTFAAAEAAPQPPISTPLGTPLNTPVAVGTDSEHEPPHPAFDFSGQWGEPRDGDVFPKRTSVKTALSSSPPPPGYSLPPAQLHGHQHVSRKQACSRSSNRHLSINQSPLAIARPLFLSVRLHFNNRPYQSGNQDVVATRVPNEKGCPPALRPDRHWRDNLCLAMSFCPSLSVRPAVLKGKSQCLHPRSFFGLVKAREAALRGSTSLFGGIYMWILQTVFDLR